MVEVANCSGSEQLQLRIILSDSDGEVVSDKNTSFANINLIFPKLPAEYNCAVTVENRVKVLDNMTCRRQKVTTEFKELMTTTDSRMTEISEAGSENITIGVPVLGVILIVVGLIAVFLLYYVRPKLSK